MKQKIFLILFFISLFTYAQNINFTDPDFKTDILTYAPSIDTNNDGEISQTEALAVTSLNIPRLSSNVTSIGGIEFFTSLTDLTLRANPFTSPSTLTVMNLSSNTALETLSLRDFAALTSVNLPSGSSLKTLTMTNNSSLTSLDVSNRTGLEVLNVFNNSGLTSLDVSGNTALLSISVYDNNLASLNLSNSTALESLDCSRNNLTSLDLTASQNLKTLRCSGNNLTSININNLTDLEDLTFSDNPITSIDISTNTGLTSLRFTNTSISSINVSNNLNISRLTCFDNSNLSTIILPTVNNAIDEFRINDCNISSIDLSNLNNLRSLNIGNNNLTSLNISSNSLLSYLDTRGNQITAIDASQNTFMQSLYVQNNALTSLNIKNGTNASRNLYFDATNNPNLTCISVDDPTAAASNNRFNKDATASYSLSCGPTVTINGAPSSTSAPFTVTFNIDRAVTGFDANDVVLTNATISNFTTTSNPNEFSATITPTSICGTNITIDVPANVMTDSGNTANLAARQVTVTTVDDVDPVILGKNITVQLDANGQVSITGTDIDNGSTDNCGIASYTALPNSFNCTNIGVNEVVLTVTDNSGNSNTATVAVTVQDTSDPTVTAQNFTVQLGSNNLATITLADLNATALDNCSATLSLSKDTFTCSDLGANNVTITATDPSGNTATATAVVTVEQDPNRPLIATANNITVQLDANGQATITPADIDDGSGSGCSTNPTLSLDKTTFDCSNIGTNTVTLTATEGGNSATDTAIVTVEDNLAPTALGKNITVQLDANGQVSITGNDIDNGSTDNCSIASYTATPNSFDCTNIGANEVVLTVTDSSGNSNTATVAVTVQDATDPTISAQNFTVQLDSNNQATISPNDVTNTFTDNCSATLSLSKDTFTCSDLGANNVTVTATDPSGNTATATAIVTVEQDPNQALTAVTKNIIIQLDTNGQATITPTDVNDGSGSGCNTNPTLSLDRTTFDCSNIGTNTVTLTATEGGISDTATAIVTVEDTSNPRALGKNITVQLDNNGQVNIAGTDIDNGSTDNCGIASYVAFPNSFDCSNIGVNEVQLTVTDNSGNTDTATVAVTVEDSIDPTITTQNITVQLGSNNQVSVVPSSIAVSFDNCSATLSLSKDTFTCSDLGANNVTVTVTDASGNTATATAIVTVEQDPNQALTAVTKNITVQLDTNGQATITPADVNDGSGSGCNTNPTLSLDRTTFDCSNIGTNTVTLTATEGGVSDTATAIVTVEDNLAPTVTTKDITVALDASGQATITASDVNNGTADNCSLDGISIDKTDFSCSDLGANTVTLTAQDSNGNSATGTATVTVVEDTAPTVVTQDITVQLDADGKVSITPQDIDNGSSDSCSGIDTITLDKEDFDCPTLGDITVILTVTDKSGNSATGTATVTITSDDEDNDGIADACDTKEVIVAKGFSPNGDNIHDTWVVENILSFPKNNIQVFNRWGEKVYEKNNYKNDWNGVSNQGGGSKKLPVGPYLYIINLNETGFMPIQGWLYINY